MSQQARAKIAAAMRARSAKQNAPLSANQREGKGGLTPAGKKKLSQLMKARWMARRKAASKK